MLKNKGGIGKDFSFENLNISQVRRRIKHNISLIDKHLEYMRAKLNRIEKDVLLYNILGKTAMYLHCLDSSLDGPTEQLAFVTRSLFETNLISQYVLKNEDNMKRFSAEGGFQRIEIFRSVLELAETDKEKSVFKDEISRMESIAEKHKLQEKRTPQFRQLAEMFGLKKEYDILYRLYSKYTHPSSYSINIKPEEIHSPTVRNTFLRYADTYAGNTLGLIEKVTKT